jgi:hypothetical protein
MINGFGEKQPIGSVLLGRCREAERDVVTIAMAKKKKKWEGEKGRSSHSPIAFTALSQPETPAGSGGPIEARVRETAPAEGWRRRRLLRARLEVGAFAHEHGNHKQHIHIMQIFGGSNTVLPTLQTEIPFPDCWHTKGWGEGGVGGTEWSQNLNIKRNIPGFHHLSCLSFGTGGSSRYQPRPKQF